MTRRENASDVYHSRLSMAPAAILTTVFARSLMHSNKKPYSIHLPSFMYVLRTPRSVSPFLLHGKRTQRPYGDAEEG